MCLEAPVSLSLVQKKTAALSRDTINNLKSRNKILKSQSLSYGPPWAHNFGGYQDRLFGGPLGLLGLCHTAPDGVGRKDYGGEVLG
jgi:hypothetical protein